MRNVCACARTSARAVTVQEWQMDLRQSPSPSFCKQNTDVNIDTCRKKMFRLMWAKWKQGVIRHHSTELAHNGTHILRVTWISEQPGSANLITQHLLRLGWLPHYVPRKKIGVTRTHSTHCTGREVLKQLWRLEGFIQTININFRLTKMVIFHRFHILHDKSYTMIHIIYT